MGIVYPNKQIAGANVRNTATYKFLHLRGRFWDDVRVRFEKWAERVERDIEAEEYLSQPAHPRVFAVLREAVVREKGGYVYPDLGLLHPAPSGAVRGLGMVSDRHYKCQSKCWPGTEEERRKVQ